MPVGLVLLLMVVMLVEVAVWSRWCFVVRDEGNCGCGDAEQLVVIMKGD